MSRAPYGAYLVAPREGFPSMLTPVAPPHIEISCSPMIYTVSMVCYNRETVMEKDKKQTIIKDFQVHGTDSGSPEVQVALLTERINRLTQHMVVHRHDYHTLRGLLKLVGQRERQLKYLSRTDPQRYRTLISRLGLRK